MRERRWRLFQHSARGESFGRVGRCLCLDIELSSNWQDCARPSQTTATMGAASVEQVFLSFLSFWPYDYAHAIRDIGCQEPPKAHKVCQYGLYGHLHSLCMLVMVRCAPSGAPCVRGHSIQQHRSAGDPLQAFARTSEPSFTSNCLQCHASYTTMGAAESHDRPSSRIVSWAASR
jgi:hypothetical protein